MAHRLMPASTACWSIAVQLVGAEVQAVQRAQVVVELRDAARADQHRGDPAVAQRPGQRHLGQRLAAVGGQLVERADVGEGLLGEQVRRERLVPWAAREPSGIPLRYLLVSMPWASGEKAMQPTPVSPSTSSRSSSIQRLSIE